MKPKKKDTYIHVCVCVCVCAETKETTTYSTIKSQILQCRVAVAVDLLPPTLPPRRPNG